MNRKVIKEIISRIKKAGIENTEEFFAMETFEGDAQSGNWLGDGSRLSEGHQCGTAMCIGGFAEHILRKPTERFLTESGIAKGLGITYGQSQAIFYPNLRRNMSDIPPSEAISMLENLLETGEVKWVHDGTY